LEKQSQFNLLRTIHQNNSKEFTKLQYFGANNLGPDIYYNISKVRIGNILPTYDLNITGDINCSRNYYLNGIEQFNILFVDSFGNARINGTYSSEISYDGALLVLGGAAVKHNINAGRRVKLFYIGNSSSSYSGTSGSIQGLGGLNIVKDAYIGGNLYVKK
jgi:hypothetical protein